VLEIVDIVLLVLIGLFGGLVGGMLGVGGSVVMIPAMTELLGPNQHLYQAAAMIVNFFVVVPAVYQHRRARAIDFRTVARLVPLSILAALAGVAVSELPMFRCSGETYLQGAFGAFLIIIAAVDLFRMSRAKTRDTINELKDNPARLSPQRITWRFAAYVAIPTGLIAGLLGVGGGVLAVPLQRRFLRIPLRQAIANSAAVIIPTSLLGATAKNLAIMDRHIDGTSPFVLAAILIPMAVLGSFIGSRWTHIAPLKMIRVAFWVLLMVAGTKLVYTTASSLRPSALGKNEIASRAWISNRNRRCLGPSSTKLWHSSLMI